LTTRAVMLHLSDGTYGSPSDAPSRPRGVREPASLFPPLETPRAAQHQADDGQDEDRPDDRSDVTAEVEHVGVYDPEESRDSRAIEADGRRQGVTRS
jgi:hypothetical protein